VGRSGRRGARRLALQALYQHQLTGDALDSLLAQFRSREEFVGVDEAYFEGLVTSVLTRRDALDARIGEAADRPPGQLDPVERAVLWIGAAELAGGEVPARVAIDEGIELAKTFGGEQGYRYVNAVLDRLARAT